MVRGWHGTSGSALWEGVLLEHSGTVALAQPPAAAAGAAVKQQQGQSSVTLPFLTSRQRHLYCDTSQ